MGYNDSFSKAKLKAFNKTMELLKKHGVDADTFDLRGEYWTSEKSQDHFNGLGFAISGTVTMRPGKSRHTGCRTLLLPHRTDKPRQCANRFRFPDLPRARR